VVAMSSALWAPDHLLSSDDWNALDREPYLHYELSDGVLVMTPRPAPRHQYVVKRVADALEDQLPSALVPLIDVEVPIRRGPAATHRAPDVVVVPRAVLALDSPLVDPAEVLLAVEVVFPGSVSTDRILKVQEYASVGIPVSHHRPDASRIAGARIDGFWKLRGNRRCASHFHRGGAHGAADLAAARLTARALDE